VHFPALAVSAVGLVLVLGTALWDHRARGDEDPVISPVEPDDGAPRRVRVGPLTTWLMPVGTVVLLVLAWVLDARGS
jgi:hypothetical protein